MMQMGLRQPIGWPKLDPIDMRRFKPEPKPKFLKRKGAQQTMTPTNGTTQATKPVTKTVFDLTLFDDVKLIKDVPLPSKPTTVAEALAAVGNDNAKLLDVIYEGLIAEAIETAKATIEGFRVVNDDNEPGEPYTGKYADEAKGKLINNAILSLAKMQGYDKSLPAEKKRDLKEKATAFLRDNPAMLATIQG